jgi:hypothetical protein
VPRAKQPACPTARLRGEIAGGLRAGEKVTRPWRWQRREPWSAPARCKSEQWYLVRAHRDLRGLPANADAPQADSSTSSAPASASLSASAPPNVLVQFETLDGGALGRVRVDLAGGPPSARGCELLGWVQAPAEAGYVRLERGEACPELRRVDLIAVCDLGPVSHPLANTPRWSRQGPALPIRRVILPESLARLAVPLRDLNPVVARSPAVLARAKGSACVLDPAWVKAGRWTVRDVERLADDAWVITDLETTAALARRAGCAGARVLRHKSRDEVFGAEVTFADAPTRGLALGDIVPYGTWRADGAFAVQALRAPRRAFRNATGLNRLLSTDTPWERYDGDVLSAARQTGAGMWIASDLPWLAAGCHGAALAPRLKEHLLRMHLGAPLEDGVQYWSPQADGTILLRDIAELDRRYPPLRVLRWSAEGGAARLGVTLGPTGPMRRHLLIRTGRIERDGLPAGLPPEPMVVFLRWLAREAAEQTPWARAHLDGVGVTWQFDSSLGLRYVVHYPSAALLNGQPQELLDLCGAPPRAWPQLGVLGDGSLAWQRVLLTRLRDWIETSGSADAAERSAPS